MNLETLRKLISQISHPVQTRPGISNKYELQYELAREEGDPKKQEETAEAFAKLSKEEFALLLTENYVSEELLNLLKYNQTAFLKLLETHPEFLQYVLKNKTDLRLFENLPVHIETGVNVSVKILEFLRNKGLDLEENDLGLQLLAESMKYNTSTSLTEYLLKPPRLKQIDQFITASQSSKDSPNGELLSYPSVSKASVKNLELFHKYGFNIKATSRQTGDSLLHLVGDLSCYDLLLRLGADPNGTNKKGESPLLANVRKMVTPQGFSFSTEKNIPEQLVELQVREMDVQYLSRDVNTFRLWLSWGSISIPKYTPMFAQSLACLEKEYYQARDLVTIAGSVLGVSATLPFPVEFNGTSYTASISVLGSAEVNSDQPIYWVCEFLEHYVGELDPSDPDKKIMSEILEAHQFTRDHLHDPDLSQKLYRRQQQGMLIIMPSVGFPGHIVGLSMKGNTLFYGNRGAEALEKEGPGAASFQVARPDETQWFIHQMTNSSFSSQGREKFKRNLSWMVDLAHPTFVKAKRQMHYTCPVVNPLINIQIMAKALGSSDPYKRYKDMTLKSRNYMIQYLKDEFNKAKQDKNAKLLNILKEFIKKVLVEHYNIQKPHGQEAIRAGELLRLFDPSERDQIVKEVTEEIRNKWIIKQLYAKDKNAVLQILRRYDVTHEPNLDDDVFTPILNFIPNTQFKDFFDEVLESPSFTPETISKAKLDADYYALNIIKVFFDEALRSPKMQADKEKSMTFSYLTDRKRKAEKPQVVDKTPKPH